jgi:predicted transcriptional regulator of viral defense system
MSAPDLDRAVAARATAQHGLVAARDVVALGGSPAAVRHRLATGRWRAAGPGVYRIAGTPVTWRSHLLAAVLAGGPGAVASHRSAGALHGLDGCRPGVPEVSVPRGRRYLTEPDRILGEVRRALAQARLRGGP